MLGGSWKHEKLRLFKARFPGSICGTPLDPKHVNRHTLDDPGNSEWLTCCVDDPKEVAISLKRRFYRGTTIVQFSSASTKSIW